MRRYGRSKYAHKLGLRGYKSTDLNLDLRSAREPRMAGTSPERSPETTGKTSGRPEMADPALPWKLPLSR